MTEEALIFRAAMAANESLNVVGKLWNEEKKLDRTNTWKLLKAARELTCAATALEERAAGVRPPKIGD